MDVNAFGPSNNEDFLAYLRPTTQRIGYYERDLLSDDEIDAYVHTFEDFEEVVLLADTLVMDSDPIFGGIVAKDEDGIEMLGIMSPPEW